MRSKKLIPHLRKNSRLSLAQLSKELEVPTSTMYEWLKQIENRFVIKHTTLFDFKKLGFQQISINLKVQKHQQQSLQQKLLRFPELNRLYTTTGMFDLVAEFYVQDFQRITELQEMLSKADGVQKSSMQHIIKEIEKERFFSQ